MFSIMSQEISDLIDIATQIAYNPIGSMALVLGADALAGMYMKYMDKKETGKTYARIGIISFIGDAGLVFLSGYDSGCGRFMESAFTGVLSS